MEAAADEVDWPFGGRGLQRPARHRRRCPPPLLSRMLLHMGKSNCHCQTHWRYYLDHMSVWENNWLGNFHFLAFSSESLVVIRGKIDLRGTGALAEDVLHW